MQQMKRYLKKFRFDRQLFLSQCKIVDFWGSGGEDFIPVKSADYLMEPDDNCYIGPTHSKYYYNHYGHYDYYGAQYKDSNIVQITSCDCKNNGEGLKSKVACVYWEKRIEVNTRSNITILICPDNTISVFFMNARGDARQTRKQAVYNLIENWKDKGFVYEI